MCRHQRATRHVTLRVHCCMPAMVDIVYNANQCTLVISASTAHQLQPRQGMKRLQRRQQVGSQWQLCLQVPQVGQRTQGGVRCC